MDAIILAGGRGSRLEPWPAPKCLLPVNGVPIIDRIVWHLTAWGRVSRVIVCTGYRASDVEAAVTRRGLCQAAADRGAILFSCAGETASMGERLLRARKDHGVEGRIIACYGDELLDVDLAALEARHERAGARATFVGVRQAIPFGVVVTPAWEGCVPWNGEEDEHPDGLQISDGEEAIVNVGFAILEPEAWEHLEPSMGLSDWVNALGDRAEPDAVACYLHEGKRATVNSLADLHLAEEVWR